MKNYFFKENLNNKKIKKKYLLLNQFIFQILYHKDIISHFLREKIQFLD